MTIDNEIFSVSPKTQIIYMENNYIFTDHNKPKMKKQEKSQDIIEGLHNYKFPKSAYQTPVTTIEDYNREANAYNRRKSSSISSTTRSPRRFSHRRSAAVSGSSNESIFSEAGAPLSSSPSTRNTHLSSINSDQPPALMHSISGCKLEFEEQAIKASTPIPVQPPKKPSLKPTTEAPQYPIIDLDIAGKPLKPRNLGSPLNGDDPLSYTSIQSTSSSVTATAPQLDQGEPEESISIVDFLRESMSERAMSVSVDYDPFQYVHLNQLMKIKSLDDED